MACVECIHFEMCERSPQDCNHFSSKSQYIKLPFPCEVGQKVWFLHSNQIIETFVEKIILKRGGLYIKLACNAMYETSCRSIGKTVFFSIEEAEACLIKKK